MGRRSGEPCTAYYYYPSCFCLLEERKREKSDIFFLTKGFLLAARVL
jgi:hypothetical protein